MPSQVDIARRLRLTQATVSLALSNHPRISASTRRRVENAARALGYRADPYVSMLMALRRRRDPARLAAPSLAVLALPYQLSMAELGTPNVFARLQAGIRARAREIGAPVDFFPVDEERRAAALPRILSARGIRGVILFPDGLDRELEPPSSAYERFAWVRVGLALADRPNVHTVSSDYAYSVAVLIRELTRRGYRRIGLAMGRGLDWANGNAVSGQFLSWQQHLAAALRVPLIRTRALLPAADETVAWFRRHRPDAVIAYTQETRRHLEAAGLLSPRDFGLAQLSWHHDSTSAGFDQKANRVGALAVDTVLRLVQVNDLGVPEHPSVTLVKGSWKDGPSVRESPPRQSPTPASSGAG